MSHWHIKFWHHMKYPISAINQSSQFTCQMLNFFKIVNAFLCCDYVFFSSIDVSCKYSWVLSNANGQYSYPMCLLTKMKMIVCANQFSCKSTYPWQLDLAKGSHPGILWQQKLHADTLPIIIAWGRQLLSANNHQHKWFFSFMICHWYPLYPYWWCAKQPLQTK